MIKSISVTNSDGDVLELELTEPYKTGIAVGPIEGLGSPKYDVNLASYGIGDGSYLGSIKAPNRNLLFTFYPLFNPQVEDSRQLLYRFFQVKRLVEIAFKLDNRDVYIEGYVEETTANIFQEFETINISVLCPDPYFHEKWLEHELFYLIQPEFEFPFCNDSLTEKLLYFGNIDSAKRTEIDYLPEVDTGIWIIIDVLDATGDITIYNVESRGYLKIFSNKVQRITGLQIQKHDRIEINTEVGGRYTRLYREGKVYDILGAVNRDMEWFQLHQGKNNYTYTTQDPLAPIVMSFRYRHAYASI